MSAAVGERAAGTTFVEGAVCAVLEALRGRDEAEDLKQVDTLSELAYDGERDREQREARPLASHGSPLAYPTDVVVDAASDRIYIADTG